MASNFLPRISENELRTKQSSEHYMDYYEALVEPLHEKLYEQQTFEFLDELSEGQQLLLSYDYVLKQVLQGGFIQYIQNGYVPLLLPLPGWLQKVGASAMARVIDDVLKVYVLNREILDKETSIREFAALYKELPEFEILDNQFNSLNEETIRKMLNYASENLDDFVTLE